MTTKTMVVVLSRADFFGLDDTYSHGSIQRLSQVVRHRRPSLFGRKGRFLTGGLGNKGCSLYDYYSLVNKHPYNNMRDSLGAGTHVDNQRIIPPAHTCPGRKISRSATGIASANFDDADGVELMNTVQ